MNKNAIIFLLLIVPRFGDYDSSQPGHPRCNYLTLYYINNQEAIEEALQCGMPLVWKDNGMYSTFRMIISNYEDLEIIAPAIEKALNTFGYLLSEEYLAMSSRPENIAITASNKIYFYTPELYVQLIGENHFTSTFQFRLTKGQEPWTQEEIIDKLHKDYYERMSTDAK